jgi:LmbE family N-acetylglucosaminyl deacetylase
MTRQLRILCIGAHPDDCEIFAGGTVLALAAAGAAVTFVVATDGSLSLGPPANDELAAARRVEAEKAARILGVDLELLGFRDGHLAMATSAASRTPRASSSRPARPGTTRGASSRRSPARARCEGFHGRHHVRGVNRRSTRRRGRTACRGPS